MCNCVVMSIRVHTTGASSQKSKLRTQNSSIHTYIHTCTYNRGIIAAVKAAQKAQISELNQALKDQTDDLIVAKIKELQKGKKKSSENFMLNNALSPQEKKQLYYSKHPVAVAQAPAAPRQAWGQKSAWGPQTAAPQPPKGSLQVCVCF
jgi:hypothetical protein